MLEPAAVTRLQGKIGNRAVSQLLHRRSIPATPAATTLLQRELNEDRMRRLRTRLGRPKTQIAARADALEYFDGLSNAELTKLKGIPKTDFEVLAKSLATSRVEEAFGLADAPGQWVELVGAALETGEEAGQVASLLGISAETLASWGLFDQVLESTGGAVAGAKDTYEGGTAAYGQKKYVEGGLLTVSGLSGLASLIPGVPDVVAIGSGAAKTGSGVTKMANTKLNATALDQLKLAAAAHAEIVAAADVLVAKNSYWEGFKTAALGGIETAGGLFGGMAKYATTVGTKALDPLVGALSYTGRAVGSTITSSIQSNAQVGEQAEQNEAAEKAAMRAAVVSVTDASAPYLGRLRRLAVLIDPGLAGELDRNIGILKQPLKTTVEENVKRHDTWNP